VKRWWLGLLVCASTAACAYVPVEPETPPGRLAEYPLFRVRRAISGDTILLDDDGHERRLRYAGVLAPEAGSAYWTRARAENARLVEGQEVRVRFVEHDGPDEYGYVFVPNSNEKMALVVQFELALAGLVQVADIPQELDDEYFQGLLDRAEKARRDRRGIYADAPSAR